MQKLYRDFSNLEKFIKVYTTVVEEAISDISLNNKPLGIANREQSSRKYYYSSVRAEIKTISETAETHLRFYKSVLYKKIYEESNKNLSERAIERFIETDEKYNEYLGYVREIKEMYEKIDAVVDAFEQRGYSLNNLTKLFIYNAENEIV